MPVTIPLTFSDFHFNITFTVIFTIIGNKYNQIKSLKMHYMVLNLNGNSHDNYDKQYFK